MLPLHNRALKCGSQTSRFGPTNFRTGDRIRTGAAGLKGYVAPSLYIDRRIKKRRLEHQAGFPDFFDCGGDVAAHEGAGEHEQPASQLCDGEPLVAYMSVYASREVPAFAMAADPSGILHGV